ncbi:response regulator transcription factor [Nocardioides sp. W7]|uniref:response regulator transcription factor n=1 Tax=Nocardioides sp. W7 TaxID=2931390 RepID=UPI001FD3F7E0|nr:response regulator transcription factor [Nocardioides sp. W7]
MSQRIAVVDDHQLFAETLVLALEQEGYPTRRFAVPLQPSSADALLAEISDFRPTIALLDLDLGPFGSGLRMVRPLAEADVAVLVLTSAPRSQWGECLLHGASRVVAKTTALHDITQDVRRLSRREAVLAPGEYEELVAQWESGARAAAELRARFAVLSAREQEVLDQLMAGRTARDIAHQWVVSEATVRTQISAILGKLEVSSQLAAVVLATQAGWRLKRD